MVSKASEDLPEPDRPVMTMSRSRGRSTSMFARLWVRAPRTRMVSMAMGGKGPRAAKSEHSSVRPSTGPAQNVRRRGVRMPPPLAPARRATCQRVVMSAAKLSPTEFRAALSLAGIFALRMFGLFMIYPVFAVYARSLPDATPSRVGLALGIYGLAQALLQMPLGLLSDRMGRKHVIAAGLVVFALGSVVAGLAHSVAGIALGRFLQGTGAVGSAVLALAADLSREQQRTKV